MEKFRISFDTTFVVNWMNVLSVLAALFLSSFERVFIRHSGKPKRREKMRRLKPSQFHIVSIFKYALIGEFVGTIWIIILKIQKLRCELKVFFIKKNYFGAFDISLLKRYVPISELEKVLEWNVGIYNLQYSLLHISKTIS